MKSTTQACLFFFPFVLLFCNSSSETMKYTKLFFSSSDPSIQCSLFYDKSTLSWSQQISFLYDYEATSEARMLQAPIKGRKIIGFFNCYYYHHHYYYFYHHYYYYYYHFYYCCYEAMVGEPKHCNISCP